MTLLCHDGRRSLSNKQVFPLHAHVAWQKLFLFLTVLTIVLLVRSVGHNILCLCMTKLCLIFLKANLTDRLYVLQKVHMQREIPYKAYEGTVIPLQPFTSVKLCGWTKVK